MGYSMRTKDWRYTAWFWYNDQERKPDLSREIMYEELYSHEGADVGDIEIERVNVAYSTSEKVYLAKKDLRYQLLQYLKNVMTFNFKTMMNKTIEKYSHFYHINNDGRATGPKVRKILGKFRN